MRRRTKRDGWLRKEIADLVRLAGLALELDGFMWLRVAVTSLRRRLHGRLATAALVLAIALRFAPFLGAAVCGAAFRPAPEIPTAPVPVASVPDLPDRAGGTRIGSASDRPAPPPPAGRGRRAFGATRCPEAILTKEVRLPKPGVRNA